LSCLNGDFRESASEISGFEADDDDDDEEELAAAWLPLFAFVKEKDTREL
jgi:hypothetical protein